VTTRKHSAGRRARFSPRDHELGARHAKSARSWRHVDLADVVRDSQPFQPFPGDGEPAQPGAVIPPTPLEAPPSPPPLRSLVGWMPTLALADGQLAVRLEDLPGFPDATLLWPVIELRDGSLAVLVRDLWGGILH
jgi:hypothetical protein